MRWMCLACSYIHFVDFIFLHMSAIYVYIVYCLCILFFSMYFSVKQVLQTAVKTSFQ